MFCLFGFTFYLFLLYSVFKVPPAVEQVALSSLPFRRVRPHDYSLQVFGFVRSFSLRRSERANGIRRQPVVGSSGLEPPTSRLSGVRSNHLSYEPMSVAVRGPAIPAYLCFAAFAAGGDEQNRTVDPLLARQVLSQLSYTPMFPQVSLSVESSFPPCQSPFRGPEN